MIFDMLAKAAEKALSSLIPILNQTKLFIFPGRAHEVLKDDYNIDPDFIRDNFFLPFKNIAVEDTASCILLWDDEKDQVGLNCTRHFLECAHLKTPTSEFNDREGLMSNKGLTNEELSELDKRIAATPYGTIAITTGKFNGIQISKKEKIQFGYDAVINHSLIVTPDFKVMPIESIIRNEADVKRLTEGTVRNAGAAIQEVDYLNSPDRFILEEMPEDYYKQRRKAEKSGRVVRRHHRPTYTPLYPKDIRSRLRLPPLSAGGPKRPHERRAHKRRYPDNPEKWPNMHGKTIVVKSSWIGPSKSKIGNKIYRVLLEL